MKVATEQQREILISWITRALEDLEPGEELYINVHSKNDQKSLLKGFKKEVEILEKVDPAGAASLHIFGTFKDKRFWVVLRKTVPSITTGFKKDLDGRVEKVELGEALELKRRLRLMRSDGFTWEEIEEYEGVIDSEMKGEIDG